MNPKISLGEFEQERLEIRAVEKKILWFTAGIVCSIFFCLLVAIPQLLLLSFALGIYVGINFFKNVDRKSKFRYRYKTEILQVALKQLEGNLEFAPNKGISETEFNATNLFSRKPDRYKTEDFIRGKLGQTPFYFAEIHAEYKETIQNGKHRQVNWYNLFKGVVFVADFNKDFKGLTLVKPRGMDFSVASWLSKNIFSSDDYSVALENVEFQQIFATRSSDQIEARYILTPALMERILDLNKRLHKTISLSFVKNRLYIALPFQRNFFEASMQKSVFDEDLLQEDISLIRFVCAIVEILDLNTRIWTKS